MKQKASYHSRSIYSIPYEFFVKSQTKAVLTDLDNTLDEYDVLSPRKEAFLLKEKLKEKGIALYVISNNHEKRVAPYCEKLGVEYLCDAFKYSKKKTEKFLKEKNLKVEEVLFVGDQLFTDGIYVSKLKGQLILTEPLSKKDQFFTRFVRGIDSFFRKRWLKKNLLGAKID